MQEKDKGYKQKEKKLKNIELEIKKLIETIKKKETFTKPKYELPKVGVLYETNDSCFLEILNYEELDEANEFKENYRGKKFFITTEA